MVTEAAIQAYKDYSLLIGYDVTGVTDEQIEGILGFGEKFVVIPNTQLCGRDALLNTPELLELWDCAVAVSTLYIQSKSNPALSNQLKVQDYTSFSRSLPTGESLSWSKKFPENDNLALNVYPTGIPYLDNLLLYLSMFANMPFESDHPPVDIFDGAGFYNTWYWELYG